MATKVVMLTGKVLFALPIQINLFLYSKKIKPARYYYLQYCLVFIYAFMNCEFNHNTLESLK